MTISVITAVRNDAAGIKKTLQTVASQADGSVQIEHIVIDGASTDSTASIIDEFVAAHSAAGNPKYTVVHESDRGIYDAMDKGRALASGDFASFLNAGDVFASRFVLASVANCIERVGNADALYYGQVSITSKYASWCRPDVLMELGEVHVRNVRDLPHHQSAFYPRRFYRENPYDIAFIKYGDTDFSLRCIENVTCYSVPVSIAQVALGGFSTRKHSWREFVAIRNDFRRLAAKHPRRFGALALRTRDLSFLLKWTADQLLGADIKHLLIRFNAALKKRPRETGKSP